MQDCGQGQCKNNATSGQYLKHNRGQLYSRDSQTNVFRVSFCSLIMYLNSETFHSHPMKGILSVHCKGLDEYIIIYYYYYYYYYYFINLAFCTGVIPIFTHKASHNK